MLSSPGWLQGMQGTVGIDGIDTNIDMGFENIVNKIDMGMSLRAEASKGRFGMIGEFFYASASDSLGVGGPLQKVDVRLDEYLADFALRWRLIEGERGFIDLLAGVAAALSCASPLACSRRISPSPASSFRGGIATARSTTQILSTVIESLAPRPVCPATR